MCIVLVQHAKQSTICLCLPLSIRKEYAAHRALRRSDWYSNVDMTILEGDVIPRWLKTWTCERVSLLTSWHFTLIKLHNNLPARRRIKKYSGKLNIECVLVLSSTFQLTDHEKEIIWFNLAKIFFDCLDVLVVTVEVKNNSHWWRSVSVDL